jgi:glycosyltransferase involved in cell wall biosynthesis
MHILFVAVAFPSPDNPYRGSFIREQVRLLCERKEIDRITVLSPTTAVPALLRRYARAAALSSLPDRYELVEGRCEVLFPRYSKLPGTMLQSWTNIQWRRILNRTVTRFVRTNPFSLIHANAGTESGWASVHVGRQHHIPCVVTYQGSEVHQVLANRRKGWRLCRDSFRYADLNLPVSRSLESILSRHIHPQGRCEVLLRGVDQSRFFPIPSQTRPRRALFVGQVQEAKGAFDLLSAWPIVRAACPDAVMTLVGPDNTQGDFPRRARALQIDGSLELTGPLPSHAVAEHMHQSQFLCLPSHGEGTPNCVMEAMSCGLPIVATRVGGIPDIVEHERSGILVDKGDIKGLAAAMIKLFRNSNLCTCMGQAAGEFAREHLDARKTVGRLVQLYGELMRSYRTRDGVVE